MKKDCKTRGLFVLGIWYQMRKILIVMKLSLLIILLSLFSAGASVYSQNSRLTLNYKNASLKEVLIAIEDQSEFRFAFSSEYLDLDRKVSVRTENELVTTILDNIFRETGVNYSVKDRMIILYQEETVSNKALQQKTITGKVTDASGQPLPGVTILIKGTNSGIITDLDGKFNLSDVPANATLVFSFVGMKAQEILVTGKSTINLVMEEDAIGIEEVVAIGYGTVKKSDLTGSLSSVKNEDINAIPATNVLQALSGRAPGVQVLQNTGAPGGTISVRIRGTNSVQGSNEPLYVVDGFPMTVSNPTLINNSDIESIEILKDASATAIYGSRGANGVILITTRQGRSGKTKVEFESNVGIQTLRKKMDLMNATEYAQFYNEVAKNEGWAIPFTQEEVSSLGKGFDWQDFVFREAILHNHNITVSGGNEKTQFSISGSMFNQDGIIHGSGYGRYSFRTNVNHEISKKFTINSNVILTKIKRDNQNSSGGGRGNTLIASIIAAFPTVDPYNEDGSIRDLTTIYPYATQVVNPAYFFSETTNSVKSNKVLANLSLAYKPISDLTIRILGGIENSDDRTDYYVTLKYLNSQGTASVNTSQYTSLLNENTVTYAKKIGKHSLSAVSGFTFQNFLSTSLSGSGSGYLSDVLESHNLGSAAFPGIPGSDYSLSVLLSALGRVNYSYNEKYLFTINFRADGSSKYSKGNKWGYFPSGAFAWRLSNEDFLKDVKFLSNLKLRAGWGETGSQAIDAYATLNNLSSGKTVLGDALFTTFSPGTRFPGDLKWETTEQADFGIDAGFWENRIRLTADYYIKKTRDLLNRVPLRYSSGYTSTIKNVGEIRNNGLELDVNIDALTGGFKWTVNGNIAFNRNTIEKLYGGEDILGTAYNVTLTNEPINILREGEAFGAFYGYTEAGYDDKGKLLYLDRNEDGVINQNDKTIIGDPNPDFIYGLNSIFSYKNFDLTVFFQGSQGNDIFNLSSVNNTLDVGFGLNMTKEVFYDHWTSDNTNAKYPALTTAKTVRVSDRFIEDGSYLRLKNVQLAYNFPVNRLTRTAIKSLQVYVSGQNLLTFTNYSWWDPEVNSKGGENSVNQGIDHQTYPAAKAINLGIRISL